mmetsp:Transcript_16815/g.35287  ORF Transcript_16815/g.35287 Transcript_16815/m.35287 type:complete len:497 (+) Transcript_16815:102-1592(+)
MITENTTNDPPHPSPENSDPFDLIQRGNACEAASNRWGAADFYSRASVALRQRADTISSQLRQDCKSMSNKYKEEKRKVVSLFRGQSLEYLYKARYFLMQALNFENDQDRNRALEVSKTGSGVLDPLCSMITVDESEKRRLIFERLFLMGGDALMEGHKNKKDTVPRKEVTPRSTGRTGPPDMKDGIKGFEDFQHNNHERKEPLEAEESCQSEAEMTPSSAANEYDDRTQSIESRLADLNSSIMKSDLPNVPPPFVSNSRSTCRSDNQNRLEEIQRGLQKLGVSLPDEFKNKDFLSENLSMEDQVKLIIQQTKDEVRVEKGIHMDPEANPDDVDTNVDDLIDEDDSMFEGYEDEEDDDVDALLMKAEKLIAKTSAEVGVTGELASSSPEVAQIRKSQSLLLEARLYLEMEQANMKVKKPAEAFSPEITDEKNSGSEAKNSETGEKNSDMDEQPKAGISNDEEEAANEDSVKSAREKARERIQNAEECLKEVLENWR